MMKSWLVFLTGGVFGAVLALGVTRIFFHNGNASASGNTQVGSVANEGPGPGVKAKSQESKANDGAELDARIASLRAWTEGRSPEPENDDLYGTLSEWAERDPRAALAWVQNAKRLPQRLRMVAVPLAALAKKNAGEAAEWMRLNVGGHDRADVLDSTFQYLANSSPKTALELVALFPKSEQPDDLGNALGALIVESPGDALVLFNRLTGDQRVNSARWMVGAWVRSDPVAAMAWAESQSDIISESQVRWALMEACSAARPDLCLEFLRKYPNSDDAYNDSRAISTMLDKSPEHGLAALSLVSAQMAESALTMWAQECFEKSPERAVELVGKWVPEKERAGVIRSGFQAWLESDHRAAMEWLGTVTDPRLQVALQAGVISWQAQRDPASALAVLSGPQANSPELRDVVEGAIMQWTHRDVVAAAGWAVANPDLVTAEQASEMTGQFLEKDEEAAADWLAKLPAGQTRDAAVETAARYWAGQGEAELAVQVAGSIRNPEKRTRTFFSIYNALMYADKEAAEKLLTSTKELSEETKQSWRAITSGR